MIIELRDKIVVQGGFVSCGLDHEEGVATFHRNTVAAVATGQHHIDSVGDCYIGNTRFPAIFAAISVGVFKNEATGQLL